jgi:8-oxo-dGTP diphosphatase
VSEPKTILVAAAVVTRADGRLLLTQRRAGTHLAGLWEFPGGKVEPGEDPERAVVRECLEECGIDIAVRDILEVTFHSFARDETGAQKHVLLLFYDCALCEGTIVSDLEVAAHAWVLPSELPNYELPAPDIRLVQKLMRRSS